MTRRPGVLAPVPVLHVPPGQEPGVASALAEPARLALLLHGARRIYTPWGLGFAEARSCAWSGRSASPYAGAVAQVAGVMDQPGSYLLNHSYEWGCTAGVAADPAGGATLVRTLDWPFAGLGRALMVTSYWTAAGRTLAVTWPGMVGVLSGPAPGRFAAAINQPPLPLPGWGRAAGWLAARRRVHRSRALPPDHLLRLAFDTCHSFAEAEALIRLTPVCLPALFTLAGPDGEALVIERTTDDAHDAAAPIAANHWTAAGSPAGLPRDASSLPRHAEMSRMVAGGLAWSLDWVRAPILQPGTRLAMLANPRSGRLLVQGWERTGPATLALDLRG